MSNNSLLSSAGAHTEHNSSTGYAVRFLEKMESLFLKEQLTDVVLVAGTRRIPAHRLVLSSASDYFAAMFTNCFKEASQNEIELTNVDGDALWALINYCYTGNVEIVTENAQTLLETASILQLKDVVEACSSFMGEQLNPSNCIGIRHLADSLGCPLLSKASQQYTNDHFVDVIQNKEFLNLSVDELTELLGSDELRVSSEEDVYRGVLSWIEHDVEKRRGHVSDLLKLIRFPLLTPRFIIDHIKTNPIIQNSPVYIELMEEAFSYHLLPERRSMLQSPRTRPRNTLGQVYVWGPSDYSSSVERYDANLNKWTLEEEMSVVLPPYCGRVEFKGKLYMVGGWDKWTAVSRVQCYDMEEKSLRDLPPMRTPRYFCGVAVLGGSLYAIGGKNSSGDLKTVERLDLQSETWSSVTPMWDKRENCGVAVLNGKLYVVGGRNEKTVECYDPDTDKWMYCAPVGTTRFKPGLGVLNGFLYALGGDDGCNIINSVERYDPSTNTWTEVASMKYARNYPSVCVLDGKLFAVGGDDDKYIINVVEVYDAVEDKWEEVVPPTT